MNCSPNCLPCRGLVRSNSSTRLFSVREESLMKLQSHCLWPVLVVATMANRSATAEPPEVTVCHPVVREVTDYDDFTGRVEAVQTVEVRARVSGYLAKIAFKEGTMVKRGDLLFEIDSRPYRAELEKAE